MIMFISNWYQNIYIGRTIQNKKSGLGKIISWLDSVALMTDFQSIFGSTNK